MKIHGTDFTVAEERELIRLLNKVREADSFWPTEAAMQAAHAACSMWAAELVVLRANEVLLTIYDGKSTPLPPKTWHIPGGYSRNSCASLSEDCARIAERELGTTARFLRIIGQHKWTREEHPFAQPLSLFCLCEVTAVVETEQCKFFPLDNLPQNLVKPHREFLMSLR